MSSAGKSPPPPLPLLAPPFELGLVTVSVACALICEALPFAQLIE